MSTDSSSPECDANLSGLGRALMGTNEGSKPSGPWVPPTAEELHQILPQYEIVKMLGRGGMGAVYMGRQTALDRPVAIKILSAQLEESDRGFTERFKNEAKAMARLNHPAIVKVFEFGEHASGLLYIVMEYVDGTDVARMIAKKGRLHTEHAMAITAHVCDALVYAHARSIIHRDIKPANVMVGYDGVVKVADFGLAKVSVCGQTLGLTQSGMAMGTMHYMAPEALMLGTSVDHRADIYAVGVMLYQMLTGKIPHGMFQMPSTQVPGLDPRYDAIVSKAMMEDREERYPQISEMRVELDSILTQPVVKAEPARPEQAVALTTGDRPQRSGGQPFRPPHSLAEPVAAATQPAPRSLAWLWVTLLVVSVFGALAWFVLPRGGQVLVENDAGLPGSASTAASSPSQSSGSDGQPEPKKSQPQAPSAAKAVSPLVVPPGYDQDASRQIAEWIFEGGGTVQIDLVKTRKAVRCATVAELPQEEGVLVWISQGLASHRTQATPFPSHLLAGVPTLRGFEIRQAKPLQKADVEALMRIPELRKISVGNMTVTMEAVKALTPSDRIDHIRLGRVMDSKDDDAVWRHLVCRYPNLTFLETQEFLKATTLAEVLPAFPKLVDFRAHMEFTPQVAEQLAQVKSLRLLDIKGLGQDHPDVPPGAFRPLSQLEGLNLFYADQLKSVLGELPRLSALKQLGLAGLGIGNEDLAALRVLGRLEILNLSGNATIDDGGVDSLKGFTTLKELRLEQTRVSDKGLALLREALPDCKITPASPPAAKSTTVPPADVMHNWTDIQGRGLQGKFLRFEGANVMLDIAGKVTPVVTSSLSDTSLKLALDLHASRPRAAGNATGLSLGMPEAVYINTLGMKFVPVPETNALFCAHETRWRDYAAFASANPGRDESWKNQTHEDFELKTRPPDHPVVYVSWEDATEFCAWLSAKEGRRFRLPTNKEWQLAATSGAPETAKALQEGRDHPTPEEFPWGSVWPPPPGAGNFSDMSRRARLTHTINFIEGYDDGFPTTAPVMSFTPNAHGIYDLSGNVFEWCEDWWREVGWNKVMRGGTWRGYDRKALGSVFRPHHNPKSRYSHQGFRCVMDLSEK
jgi:serine/threonine protein kinase